MGVPKVLIIGIGNPIPSFIKRRLLALEQAGISLLIVAEHRQSMSDFKSATIVRVGGCQSFGKRLMAIMRVVIRPFDFYRMLMLRTEVPWRSRIKWAIKYFPLTRLPLPDVVHFQWLSYLPEFKWLRYYYRAPFIGSARGSQVTVYPRTRVGYKSIMQEAMRDVDFIHGVSASMHQACMALGASPEKLFINYNGINLELFRRQPESASEANVFTLISVGNMMWRKGFGYQLQLIKKLLGHGRTIKLIWLGEGPDREGLVYTCHMMNLNSNVQFVGKVSSSEIARWLNQADAYVSTSVAEGLSNSMVEAAACSLPILAFACEGAEEVMEEGKSGFIVPFGDVDQLVDKVVFLMDNKEICLSMGKNSRAIAEARFNEKTHVQEMVKVYKRIARKKPIIK